MPRKKLIILIIIIILAGIFYFSFVAAPNNEDAREAKNQNYTSEKMVFNPKTCQYLIDGILVTDAQYFGGDITGDFNSDGRLDEASIIFQNTEGSGTFYYLVVAFNQTDESCRGSNAILLGDRITPQNIEYKDDQITVNYLDRKPDEPMSTPPSVAVSKYYKIEANTLIEINQASSTMTENYRNDKYGFSLSLPPSWQNYSIIESTWNGELLVAPNTKYEGPKIIIRNPNWTESKHYQDIPVMIFTPDEWKLISEENLGVSAAPIGPSKLGENGKYVFALPPRWIGFTDDIGQDQAAEIVKTFQAY